jgi:hypothetical protein
VLEVRSENRVTLRPSAHDLRPFIMWSMGGNASGISDSTLVEELRAFIEEAVARNGGSTAATKPGHRVHFHWPPHPISHSYHVLASDWRGKGKVEIHGEVFPVRVARTQHGEFGRIDSIWVEGRGGDEAAMYEDLRRNSEPLFARQIAIAETLGVEGRFSGSIRDLPDIDLLKLLYCPDRDVSNEAKTAIELHASTGIFGPALVYILRDNRHPCRRAAQWCVLDLFEDIHSFCPTPEEESAAVTAMRNLLWNAEDDFARTIYKAGVVLGGHIPDRHGGPVLLECLRAPSAIGRRSAIHGLFHVVEWHPESRVSVVKALQETAAHDPDPVLREYAAMMARDIASGQVDHVGEPVFDGEE